MIFETTRLRVREFYLSDSSFILELLNTPDWLKFIGDRNVKNETDAVRYMEEGPMQSYRKNGFGLWMAERNEDNLPVGMCGFLNRETLETPDIGFAFLPEHQGKGYGFEVASAAIKYGKEKLNMPKISAITLANNNRSIHLLEKIGMSFSKTIQITNTELLLYCTA